VFFVKLVNKPGWSSVVAVKPRNLFAMTEEENEDDINIDSIDLGIRGMNLLAGQDDLTN
jgi:hypothetical protein